MEPNCMSSFRKHIVRWQHQSQMKNDSFCLTKNHLRVEQNATGYPGPHRADGAPLRH